MTDTDEYRALRATIRERGSIRISLAVFGLAAWGGLSLAVAVETLPAWAVLVPLLVLSLTFETVFALHVGVERIGRYVQVFYEEEAGRDGWESRIMEFGRRFPGGGTDPLFGHIFWMATAVNILPLALPPRPGLVTLLVVAASHVGLASRIGTARRVAASQRALDLDRFRQLRAERSRGTADTPTAG